MSVKVTGLKDVLNELEKQYSTHAQTHVRKRAVKKGGDYLVNKMKQNMASFSDTGKTVRETNLWGPNNWTGFTNAKINWQGPTERYRIIHLNEFGHYDRSGKWVNPAGKGVVDSTLQRYKDKYFDIIKDEIEKGV